MTKRNQSPLKEKLSLFHALEARQKAATGLDYWQSNPVAFIRNRLKSDLITDQQVAIAESVLKNEVTLVQSANGVGKTYIAAGIGLWFLYSFRFSKVITAAAPPESNLKNLLWGEVDHLIANAPDLVAQSDISSAGMRINPQKGEGALAWHMIGVAIPSSGSSEERKAKFSGKHAPYMLFIVDEGDAVPQEVYDGIEACMTGGKMVRLLVLFNPRGKQGPILRLIQSGANIIQLTAFEHPNVVEGKHVIPGAVSREATVMRVSRYSYQVDPTLEQFDERDNAYFKTPQYLDGCTYTKSNGQAMPPLVGGAWRKVTESNLYHQVLARFPQKSSHQLIDPDLLRAAQNRWISFRVLNSGQPPAGIKPVYGLDVAEFGDDLNALCRRFGSYVAGVETWGGVSPDVSGRKAAERAILEGATALNIDGIGVGAGAVAEAKKVMATAKRGSLVNRVMVSESPTKKSDRGEFRSLRDQLWWAVREWLETDPAAMLPDSEELAEELLAVDYDTVGKYITVSKREEVKRRIGRSPDMASALITTFAEKSNGWLDYAQKQAKEKAEKEKKEKELSEET